MGEKKVDIERFIRFLIQLGCIYNVDDEGYIISKDPDDDKPVLLKDENRFKNLIVLKDVIKDPEAIVVNPLNENITESVDSRWLYNQLKTGLGYRLRCIVKHLNFIITSESADSEGVFSTDELKFATRHKEFNKKAYDAVDIIGKKMLTFAYVWYNRKQKEAHLGSSIYDPDTIAEFPQFTPKVWKTMGKLFGELFDVNEELEKGRDELFEKYTVGSDLINIPKLESILKVYFKVYSHLNKYLEMCNSEDPDFVIDLTEFGYHLEHLQDYYNKAKWFTGNIAENKPEPAQTSFQTPFQTSIPPKDTGFRGYEESSIPSNPFRRHSEFDNPMQMNRCGGYYQQPLNFGQQQQTFYY